jgi:hypothetical protein
VDANVEFFQKNGQKKLFFEKQAFVILWTPALIFFLFSLAKNIL